MADLDALRRRWLAAWPSALATWSRFTRLSEPRWCLSADQAGAEGLTKSFAMIRLDDHAVVVNLAQVAELGLADFAPEILAHEIGHHVYCPADLTDNARLLARSRWSLPTHENLAGLVCNLYADLLINDRLQRSHGMRLDQVYQALQPNGPAGGRLWTLYMRIYEILWSRERGSLAGTAPETEMEGDAQLGARLVRHFARDWLDGAGRFAALCFPYLLEEGEAAAAWHQSLRDLEQAGRGGQPSGLTAIEPGEREGALHPAFDPALNGSDDDAEAAERLPGRPAPAWPAAAGGQNREPYQYGEILRDLGLPLDDHEIAVRYYRERALPHLIPYPQQPEPRAVEPLPEGLEPWALGAPLEDIDWLHTLMASPRVIPGLTTLQRVWGDSPGQDPRREPVDLDLYVDSSGSMPDPQRVTSYLTLAGAIVALSALRTGARVQATLWSGPRQFVTSDGFVRDEAAVLRVLTGCLGGSTAFPLHILRDTYQGRPLTERPVHILVISDDGVTTLFAKDEAGADGKDISAQALARARGGATMVLGLGQDWQAYPDLVAAHAQGWNIHAVRSWEDLVAFARAFSRLTYGQDRSGAERP